MAEHERAHPGLCQSAGELRASLVGEVAAVGQDAALEIDGVAPGAEHIDIVVCLDHRRVAPGERVEHLRRHAAGVGADAETGVLPRQNISYALGRVVHCRKSGEREILQRDALPDRDRNDAPFQPRRGALERVGDGLRRIDLHIFIILQQHRQTGDMVGVLVRDENGRKIVRRERSPRKAGFDAAQGNARVEKHRRASLGEKIAVAARAAGKGNESHPAAAVPRSVPSGSSMMRMSAPRRRSLPTKFS